MSGPRPDRWAAGDPRLGPVTDDVGLARALVDAVAARPDERARIGALIDELGPAVVDRRSRPGHLTGSAVVLDGSGTHTLLLLHAKLGKWLQPGGHADGDLNLVHVAFREATEETGIAGLTIDPVPVDLDIHEVRPPSEDAHLHLDVRFLVIAPPDAVAVGNHESTDLRWIPVSEVSDLGVDPGLERLVERAMARLREAT